MRFMYVIPAARSTLHTAGDKEPSESESLELLTATDIVCMPHAPFICGACCRAGCLPA